MLTEPDMQAPYLVATLDVLRAKLDASTCRATSMQQSSPLPVARQAKRAV